jgi:flagellar basal body rod protein FlgB
MQSLAENVMAYRQATELLRARYNMLQMVIRERP